jgi:hypothetical protein
MEKGVCMGVVRVSKDNDGSLRLSTEGVSMVGDGWEC